MMFMIMQDPMYFFGNKGGFNSCFEFELSWQNYSMGGLAWQCRVPSLLVPDLKGSLYELQLSLSPWQCSRKPDTPSQTETPIPEC